MAAPQPSATPSAVTDSEPSSPPSDVRDRARFHAERDPIEEFRQDANNTVLRELGPGFPELPSVLSVQTTISNDARYRRVVFQLLDAAKDTPADRRPAMLFAADEVAQGIWCAFENKAECDQLRVDFARYQLTLAGAGLGGVFIYPHDLLWRLWRDYPETEWGERAFVLLLNEGWDTSGTCQKGAEQFREVIQQGESFLKQRARSPQRGMVTLLVAEAYASWWSLSNERKGSGMSDYVDPKRYEEGAEEARIKAIAYFEEVLQLTPETGVSRFALEVLPPLRDKQVLDNYRFYCVYD
jgi:hypothetical protein